MAEIDFPSHRLAHELGQVSVCVDNLPAITHNTRSRIQVTLVEAAARLCLLKELVDGN